MNRFRWVWTRTVETLRYEGPLIFLLRAVRFGLSPLGELLIFRYLRMDLADPIDLHDARIDIEVGPVSRAEFEELEAVIWDSYHPARKELDGSPAAVEAMLRARYDGGATCFVARRNRRIVHYNWVFERRFEGAEAVIALGPDEAHCDNGFTTEDSRGQGVHAAVNSRMLAFLRERGNRIAYTRLTTDNRSSEKALQRVGWEPFAEVLAFLPRRSDRVFTRALRGPLGPVRPKRRVGSPT